MDGQCGYILLGYVATWVGIIMVIILTIIMTIERLA